MKQKYFEFGEKPQKLLARQLRKIENDCTIYRIKLESGALLTSPKDINSRFKQFYQLLYSSKATADPAVMQTFLENCYLPCLSQEDQDFLGSEITLEEINQSIKSMKGGKNPGPDELGCEVYKAFSDSLSPCMLKMFIQALEDGCLLYI